MDIASIMTEDNLEFAIEELGNKAGSTGQISEKTKTIAMAVLIEKWKNILGMEG